MTQAPNNQQARKWPKFGVRGKTLWDGAELLAHWLVPIFILLATFSFNTWQGNNTLDQQREDVLSVYQKDIAGLILAQPLDNSAQGTRVRQVAGAYTREALDRLESVRKGRVIEFLYGAHLLQTEHPIIDLKQANLSGVRLNAKTNLSRINLSGADLSGANLSQVDLSSAYLKGVDLSGATLTNTNLSGAYLWLAKLEGVDLSTTKLQGADLSDANLQGAIVNETGLDAAGVRLSRTTMKNGLIHQADASACSTSELDQSDDPEKWNIGLPQDKQAQVSVSEGTAPNADGNALQIAFLGGNPYSVAGTSRPLLAATTIKTIDLSLCFYLTNVNPIQGFSLFVNRWVNNQRYELALEWEVIGDGTPQQGTPPTWRYWTGKNWQHLNEGQPLAGRQPLTEGKWHQFDLKGQITTDNGQVRYVSFSLDGVENILNQPFPAVPSDIKDGLDVGVNMSSNAHGEPFDIYIDGVVLSTQPQ